MNLKYFYTVLLFLTTITTYSQSILLIGGKSGDILIPFTENTNTTEIPCEINSGKWKDYTSKKLLDSVLGNYSVFSFNGFVAKTKVLSIDTSKDNGPDCGPLATLSDKFSDTEDMYAIKSTWNVQPRPITILSNNNAAYEQVVKSILEQKAALKNAKPVIQKIVKVDLDGDQKDEIIIHATNHANIYDGKKGDYSMVIIRHLVNEKVVTDILNFRYIDKNCDLNSSKSDGIPCWLTQYKISAILDVNGDGKMEVFIKDSNHESEGINVYELSPKGLKAVLGWGCGV